MKYNIFTDGSYKRVSGLGEYVASAAIVYQDGQSMDTATALTKVSSDSSLLPLRNVSGEIMAVMMAMEHCLNVLHLTGKDTVVLHFDYVGIHNWCKRKDEKGFWNAKNPITQAYRTYMNERVKTSFRVVFKHTPGHSGIAGNEFVDRLAKEAIDSKLTSMLRT